MSREAVVDAAIALADEDGLPGLSMRRLGARLGVEGMSLYHYVADKSALLDAMVDAVFEEIRLPEPGATCREGLGSRAISQRAALRHHGWATGLLDSRSNPGPATLRHHDAVLGFLYECGFGSRAAGHAFALLDSYAIGFVVQEHAIPVQPDTVAHVAASTLAAHPGLELTHLARFVEEVVTLGEYDFSDEFEVGLAMVLDAVEALLARASRTDGGAPRRPPRTPQA